MAKTVDTINNIITFTAQGDSHTEEVYVDKIRWVAPIAGNNTFVMSDDDGNILYHGVGEDGHNFTLRRKVSGLIMTTLTGGTVYVYLYTG